jgi:hypothetical protein
MNANLVRILTRTWFALLVVAQLAFVALLPAGLGNDELGHLTRMWALTEGHFHCDKLPQAVRVFEAQSRYALRTRNQSFAGYWRDGLLLGGTSDLVDGSGYECSYFPLALVVPAAVTRAVALDWHGHVRRGGVFVASYAARFASLLVVDLALWLFLRMVPWAAFLALGFLSVPMAIEQSVSVGHEGTLLALCLLILVAFFNSDDRRGVLLIALCAVAMTLIKPVFFALGLLGWPKLTRFAAGWRRLWFAAVAVMPSLAWRIWYRLGDVATRQWHPRFADPDNQLPHLLHHPLRVLAGYLHYFVDDGRLPGFLPHRINGVWNTFFFANLWIDLPLRAYLCAAVGLALAVAAAALSPKPATIRRTTPFWARAAAVAGASAAIPATIFALYLIFSPVGAPGPYGVQGRYHAVPFLTLSLLAAAAVEPKGSSRRAPLLAAGAAVLLLAADAQALFGTWRYYWVP